MIVDILMVVLGIVLTAGTFMFVSAEFSLVALDQASVERRAAAGDKRAAHVLKGTSTLSTQLSGAQVGITLTTILLGYTTQTTLNKVFAMWIQSAGVAAALSTTIAVIVSAVIINAFSMLFGELVPKNLALAHPLKTAGWVVGFQMAFTTLFKPIIAVLNATANGVLHLFGIEPQEELSSARSASELAALVRHSAEEGTLDTSTAALFTKSIRITELSAVDVMTDRGRMTTIPSDASASDVIDAARETGHSRFPVIGEDTDDIVGFVNLRRAIAVPFGKRSEVSVLSGSLLSEAPRVPETMQLAPLLVELRGQGMQMAVVVDEYGGVSGIVTLEDVVEEIVGEVSDEHDHRRHGIKRGDDGTFMVPGTLRPDELEESTGVLVPDDGPYETLAGLVMDRLGKVPEVGDEVEVQGVHLAVTGMDGRRVTQIKVTPKPEVEHEEVHL